MKRKHKKKSRKNKQLLAFLKIVLFIFAIFAIVLGVKKYFQSSPDYLSKPAIPDGYSVVGIDVSHHNGEIDWDLLQAQGISFAYIKATEGGSHIDKRFIQNYKKAKENNILTGAYHFFRFYEPIEEQLKHFSSVANNVSGDLIPMIDVEHSRINYKPSTKERREVIARLREFEKGLQQLYGVKPIIYTNKQCYRLYIKDNFPKNKLWICDLSAEPNDILYPNWVIWQYSHRGNLHGINHKVDMNVLRGNKAELKNILLP
jgi:lysozyme